MGMCLYAQLVQTKNKQCKSAIIWVALKSDGTVYAGQPAVHLVRRALVFAVLWPVMSKNFNWNWVYFCSQPSGVTTI